ncbi:transposase, partial [PVC group bacterium (ex Bugula neritina AB1)]
MRKTKRKGKNINPELIKALLNEVDDQDLFGQEGFFQKLKESLANGILEGELEHHLGYKKHNKSPKINSNRRNGHYSKSVLSDEDTLALQIPRDRDNEFEPRLIPKGVRRFDGFDDKVISLYARGMTMREIQEHLYEIYGTEVSPELIS